MSKKTEGGMSHKKTHVEASQSGHRTVHKQVKIKHHHAKPYRKRHYGSLLLLLMASFVLLLLIVVFNAQVQENTNRAKTYLADLFSQPESVQRTISSTYGYTVAYNPATHYATAIDTATGNVFIGDELNVTRSYQVVRISSSWSTATPQDSSLTLEYQQAGDGAQSLDAVQAALVAKESSNQSSLVKLSSTETTLDGQKFLKTNWRRTYTDSAVPSKLSPRFTTYVGIVNGKPFTILLSQGTNDDSSGYDQIIKSITFSKKTAAIQPVLESKIASARTVFDSLMFAGLAKAAAQKEAPSTEYITSLYGPTVVRVYNVYCQDISIDGKPYLKNVCNAGAGSGFIVSSDGYVATNGHVAGSSAKDAAIADAIQYLVAGDNRYFLYLAKLANLTDADLASAKTVKEAAAIAVNKFYEIPDSRFTLQNSVSNLLVTLGEQQPDVQELIKLTQLRKEYPEQSTIKRAKLSAIDYRLYDGINGFKASDVAIIKVDGNNYPVAKLGAVSDISQGSVLDILGFPAGANNNGLVDNKKSTVTLTTGKVAAIKDAQGNGNKLIETDTEIGHGNSGGPAMNDQGVVVGIATYTIDGAGQGNGVFNYIRDIGDLKALASKSSITFNTKSQTQTEWQKGVDEFYKAHYSKAIKNFEKVKTLYPSHPTVNTLIANANKNIADGKEVKEFPIILVLSVLLIVVLIGAGIAIVVIIRHRKKHAIYQQNVATGNIQPMQPGDPVQYVSVNPAATPYVAPQALAGQAYVQPPQPVAPQTQPAQPTNIQVQPAQPQVIPPQQQTPPPQQPPQVQG